MMINPKQLRSLIADTLFEVDLFSLEAAELLFMTAAQESHCGEYIQQLGRGPALGIFQMEPDTEQDILENYIQYRPQLQKIVDRFRIKAVRGDLNLRGNIPYQIVMARIHYLRVPVMLPHPTDIEAMAEYYKKYYNTYAGKATVEQAVENYNRFMGLIGKKG
ncbi:MAG: hypothetical protein GY861_05610 [bacterium]|nr:hypothetical protein [bacterium]